jgi:hypothetical protein
MDDERSAKIRQKRFCPKDFSDLLLTNDQVVILFPDLD